MTKFFRFCIYFLLTFTCCAQAAQVAGLYEAELPVESADTSALPESFRLGLQKVLVKITGRKNVLGSADVKSALKNAGAYVQQYAFVDNPAFDVRKGVSQDNSPSIIQVSYQKAAVMTLLNGAGQPVWGSNRPSVLVWSVVDEDRTRRFLSGSEREPLVDVMRSSAKDWGVPLFFPVMDLEDESSLSVSDVWGGFLLPVQAASKRYQADLVLLLKISVQRSGQWLIQGTLLSGDQSTQFESHASEVHQAADGIVEQVAGLVADKYAVVRAQGGVGEVTLIVGGVTDYSDYSSVIKYVRSLAPVTQVIPEFVERDTVKLKLKIHGYADKLQQYIGLDSALVPEMGGGLSGDEYSISYRWNR